METHQDPRIHFEESFSDRVFTLLIMFGTASGAIAGSFIAPHLVQTRFCTLMITLGMLIGCLAFLASAVLIRRATRVFASIATAIWSADEPWTESIGCVILALALNAMGDADGYGVLVVLCASGLFMLLKASLLALAIREDCSVESFPESG